MPCLLLLGVIVLVMAVRRERGGMGFPPVKNVRLRRKNSVELMEVSCEMRNCL